MTRYIFKINILKAISYMIKIIRALFTGETQIGRVTCYKCFWAMYCLQRQYKILSHLPDTRTIFFYGAINSYQSTLRRIGEHCNTFCTAVIVFDISPHFFYSVYIPTGFRLPAKKLRLRYIEMEYQTMECLCRWFAYHRKAIFLFWYQLNDNERLISICCSSAI